MTDKYSRTFVHGLHNGERKKASKISSLGCYSKFDTQQRYLSTKPVCFIIYGKPGLPTRELGNKLAHYWKCIHINPQDLVEEQIKLNSDTGRCLKFNLRCGNIIDSDILFTLIDAKIQTDVVMHRGYVLSEVPLINNSEGNISYYGEFYSEFSFLVMEAFLDNLIDKMLSVTNIIEELISSVVSRDYTNYETVSLSKPSKNNIDTLPFDYSSEFSNIITVKNPRSVDKTYDLHNVMMRTVNLEADFVIYLTCPKEDIINVKNKNMTTTPSLFEMSTSDNLSVDRLNITDAVWREDETYLNSMEHLENKEYLCKRPSDCPEQVYSQCGLYDSIFPMIENELMSRECGFGIKIDGRLNIETLLNQIITCISVLPIYRVLLPKHYKNFSKDTSKLSPRTFLDSFNKNNTPLSESLWVSKCPVALNEGKCVTGCIENAVVFFDNIFLFSTSDAADLFCRNPRPYLNSNNLKPTCRIVILGTKGSGKTILAKCLSRMLGGEIVTLEYVKNCVFIDKKNVIMTQVCQKAMSLVMESRKNLLICEDKLRKEQLDVWKKESLDLIQCYVNKQNTKINESDDSLVSGISICTPSESNITSKTKSSSQRNDFPSDGLGSISLSKNSLLKSNLYISNSKNLSQIHPKNNASITATILPTDSIEMDECQYSDIKKIFRFDVVSFDILELCRNVLLDPECILKYAPHHLITPVEFKVLKETDEDVVVLTKKLVDDDNMFDDIHITDEDIANKLVVVIKEIEKNQARVNPAKKYGSWIIDGMTLDPNYWYILNKSACLPDDIFSLYYTENFDFSSLKSRTKNYGKSLTNIFEKIKNPWDQSVEVFNLSKIDSDVLENESFQELCKKDSSSISVTSTERSLDYIAIKKDIDEFKEDWIKLKIFLDDIPIQPIELNVNKYFAASELLTECLKLLKYRYSVNCKEYDSMADISENFNDETPYENLSTELTKLEDSQLLGETNSFCPVVFGKYNVLWRGKQEFTTKYKQLIYMLSSVNAFEDFKSDPESFLQFEKPIKFKLPPRICITGLKGNVSIEVCKLFAEKTGLVYVNFFDFVMLSENSDTSRQFYDLLNHSDLNLLKSTQKNEFSNYYDDETMTNIGNYFIHNHPMPENFLAQLIKKLWFTEPFCSEGFILHGFPRIPSDFVVIKEFFAIPDMVIELRPDLTLASENMINDLIDEWKSEQNNRKSKCLVRNKKTIDKWKIDREARFVGLSIFRKILLDAMVNDCDEDSLEELMTPRSSRGSPSGRKLARAKRISSKSIVKNGNSNNVRLTEEEAKYLFEELDREIPEPIFEDEWESDESAKKRISGHVNEWFISDIKMLKSLGYLCNKNLIPWVGIDDDFKIRRVLKDILKATKDVRNRNQSFFEQTLQLPTDSAEKMIKSGLAFISEFGVDCPVLVHERDFLMPTYFPDISNNNIFPVLHRNYVYYCSGMDNCRKFCTDPLKYLVSYKAEKIIQIPFKVAILGPPNSGKTTLSRRFENDLGAKILTRCRSVDFVLEKFPWTCLAKQIKEVLQRGDVLNKHLIIQAVKLASSDVKCSKQGFVFDGFPEDKDEALALIAADLFPHVIIDLKCDEDISIEYLSNSNCNKNSDSFKHHVEYLTHLYRNWAKDNTEFKKWLVEDYQNIATVDASNSKWRCWWEAHKIILACMKDIQLFLVYGSSCLSLKYLSITREEFQKRSSNLKDYCPTCLKEGFLQTNDNFTRCGLVEYAKSFYWFCEKHVEEFIRSPCDLKEKLPKYLPEKITHNLTKDNVHENGKCIVTFVSNFPSRKVVQGNPSFAARYKDIIYLFADNEKMSKFLTEPEKYSNFKINFKYDELFSESNVLNLPNMGYFEQYLNDIVTKAAINTAKFRPKYPGLDARTSAALHLALYLKINDPEATPANVELYKNINEDFEKKCQLVRRTLNVMMHMNNPWLED